MPHDVTLPAATFFSTSQLLLAASEGTTPGRRLRDQSPMQQQFETLDGALDRVLTEELRGAAVGAQLSLSTTNLTAHYLSIRPADLVQTGAQCGAFWLPPSSSLQQEGQPAALNFVVAKARPAGVLPWATGAQSIVTDVHALTVHVDSGSAAAVALVLPPREPAQADLPRTEVLPEDDAMRSHCVGLDGDRWYRLTSVGAGEPPAGSYDCAVLSAPAIVAVEDAPRVRIDAEPSRNLSALLILIIVLLTLLAALILTVLYVYCLRLHRARQHRIRIRNAELGELLVAAPFAVGGKRMCFAVNLRTTPDLVLLEEPL